MGGNHQLYTLFVLLFSLGVPYELLVSTIRGMALHLVSVVNYLPNN